MVAFKNTAPVVWILVSIGMFVSGLIMIFNVDLAREIVEFLLTGLFFLVGVMYIISVFLKTTESRIKHLGIGIICVLGGIALLVAPQMFHGVFNFITGVLGVIIGLLVLLNAIKLKKDGAPWVYTLLTALVYIGMGLILVFVANQGRLFSLLLGIYLIMFSLNIFGDALVALMGSNDGAQKIKKHVWIAIPTVLVAFLPAQFLKKVNKLVEEEPEALLFLTDESRKKIRI